MTYWWQFSILFIRIRTDSNPQHCRNIKIKSNNHGFRVQTTSQQDAVRRQHTVTKYSRLIGELAKVEELGVESLLAGHDHLHLHLVLQLITHRLDLIHLNNSRFSCIFMSLLIHWFKICFLNLFISVLYTSKSLRYLSMITGLRQSNYQIRTGNLLLKSRIWIRIIWGSVSVKICTTSTNWLFKNNLQHKIADIYFYSVVDPDMLNLDPDLEICPNLNPDPSLFTQLHYQFLREIILFLQYYTT